MYIGQEINMNDYGVLLELLILSLVVFIRLIRMTLTHSYTVCRSSIIN